MDFWSGTDCRTNLAGMYHIERGCDYTSSCTAINAQIRCFSGNNNLKV